MRATGLVVLMAFILAGCSEPAANPEGTDDDSGADGGSDAGNGGNGAGNGGNGAGQGTNTAPVANLTASKVKGTAPLNVTFTIHGTDADGDDLTWRLAANGTELANGSALPATVDHSFDAGSFEVILTISDGVATNTSSLFIDASAAGAAIQIPDTITLTGTVDGVSVGGAPGSSDTQTFQWVGRPRTMTFHMEHDSVAAIPEVDHDLDWSWTGPGGISGGAADFYGPEEDVTFDDPPEGEWRITMEKYSGPGETSYTVTITFT